MVKPACTIITTCDGPRGNPHEKDYQRCALRLVKSVRARGGSCASLPVVCVHGEEVPPTPETIQQLVSLGCRVVGRPTPYPWSPNAIKLAAIQVPVDTDYLLWMDSDIFVMTDFAELLQPVELSAAPTSFAYHRWARPEDAEDWAALYRALGKPVPAEVPRLVTHIDGVEGRFYLASGVALFRRSSGLHVRWAEVGFEILRAVEEGRLAKHLSVNCNQTSLSIVALESKCDFLAAPERLHFVYALRRQCSSDSVLVHYQDSRVTEVPDEEWFV